MTPPQVILASASAARAALLRAAGLAIDVVPARVDETAVTEALQAEGAPPRDIADALAQMKALRVSARHPQALVIGADQVLVCDGRLFDKPADRAQARTQLQALRGRPHQLISAAVIALGSEPLWRHVGIARLTMRPFSDAFLDAYLDKAGDALLTCVGAYQLEALGAQLFARVDGDHFVIQGLPLLEVLGFLRARGVLIE